MYFCVRCHVFVCQRSCIFVLEVMYLCYWYRCWSCICVLEVMYLCVRGHVFVCQRSCISVLWISMLPLSTILIFHCVIVTTVWYSIAKKSQFKMHFNAHYIIFCIVHIFFVKSDTKIVCPTNTCNVLFIYSPEFNLLRDETSLVC